MTKYYEGWVYDTDNDKYRFYPSRTTNWAKFKVIIIGKRVKVYKSVYSTEGPTEHLTQWFQEPCSPTEEELTLFELEFGVDVSYPLSQLFS